MFLKRAKVKRFVRSVAHAPVTDKRTYRAAGRSIVLEENKNPDDIFTIIGTTVKLEGKSEYEGHDEGYSFKREKTHRVYIVAKSMGKRYYVLPEDIDLVED